MKTRPLSSLIVIIAILAQGVSCKSVSSSMVVFQPSTDSPFKIMFTYPDNWEWSSPPNSITRTFGMINALDPYPAINPELTEGHRFISINVGVDSRPRSSMQEYVALFLQEPLRFEVLDDRALEIDERDARWVTIKRHPDLSLAESYINATFIEEHIFFWRR